MNTQTRDDQELEVLAELTELREAARELMLRITGLRWEDGKWQSYLVPADAAERLGRALDPVPEPWPRDAAGELDDVDVELANAGKGDEDDPTTFVDEVLDQLLGPRGPR